MAILTIRLDGFVPKSLNEILRTHYHGRKKEHLEPVQRALNVWWYGLSPAYRLQLQKVFPIQKCNHVTILYWFKDKRKRDYDNYSGKYIYDALKGFILADDNSGVIGESRIRIRNEMKEQLTLIEIDY